MIFGCNSTSEKVNRSLFRHCSKMWVVLCTRVVKTSVLLMSVGHCFIGNYSNNEWLFLSNTILNCWVEIESRPCIFPFDVIFISLWKPFAIDDLVSAWLIMRSSRMMIRRNKQVLLNCGSADRGTFGTHILLWEKKSSDEGSFSGIKEEYFIWMSRYIKKKTYFYFNVIFFISENGISIEQC